MSTESIIKIAMSEMQTQIEDGIVKAVREIGVIIDCECGYIFSKHYGDGYYSVPSTAKSNYCPYCGQALDWGDSDHV